MDNLTANQQKVYDFLISRSASGLPPTVREICAATDIRSTSTVFAVLTALESKGLISRGSGASRAIRVEVVTPHVDVPLVGTVTAGIPILATENIEQYIPISADVARGRDMFALRVKGMSMMNAGILDGDIVYAHRTPYAEDGDIVVALIDDEATVKRLGHNSEGRVVLMPENDAFEPILPDEVAILGKVVASFRQY